jgi:chemotaxis protein CheD
VQSTSPHIPLHSVLGNELPELALATAEEVILGQTGLSSRAPLHTLVGASIAVCLLDTGSDWCGLRQVMLPSLARGHRHDAMLLADAALEDLFNRLCSAAGVGSAEVGHNRIQAKLFGGADLGASGLCFSDGSQSSSFVRNWLATRHIPVAAESLGGHNRREIVLVPQKAAVYCRLLNLNDEFLDAERQQLAATPPDAAHKVELF